jgi:endonuclease YncB( thermonuclease family)
LFVMKKLSLAALIAVLTACSQTSAQQAKRPAPADTVATVGGTPITLAEVDDKALEQPVSNFGSAKLSQALYEARRAALDELVAAKLIDAAAKAQGVERAALIEKEITAKVQAVSDADVAAWYQANQGRLQGAPLDQVRQPIRAFLTQERMQGVRAQYIDTLKAKTTVTVMLDPPRQKVEMVASSPSRGPASAPVEVVDFSDFQ